MLNLLKKKWVTGKNDKQYAVQYEKVRNLLLLFPTTVKSKKKKKIGLLRSAVPSLWMERISILTEANRHKQVWMFYVFIELKNSCSSHFLLLNQGSQTGYSEVRDKKRRRSSIPTSQECSLSSLLLSHLPAMVCVITPQLKCLCLSSCGPRGVWWPNVSKGETWS